MCNISPVFRADFFIFAPGSYGYKSHYKIYITKIFHPGGIALQFASELLYFQLKEN